MDYLAFVPDGEPTLDLNLGRVIEDLRPLGIKIAVITNSSLIETEYRGKKFYLRRLPGRTDRAGK